MTKEKEKTDLARSVSCIFAALALGAFLGSPVPKVWVGQVSEAMSVVSQQIDKAEKIHNETAVIDDKAEVNVNKEADVNVNKDPSIEDSESNIKVIVSEPKAEEQPDYICLNANRGGAADRKETDVLIRLINAEAYGLSYKAKLAVGQVVMNRWTGPYYGDDLLAIMTAPYQFTPIYDGSAYEKEIEPESIKAANAVLNGAGVNELTDDTYYFVDPEFTEDKTIEQKMQFVCEIEGIHFYKPPNE
ncbi:MAG TPA: cell wall hydrolase [Anaerovoracaceae bacterium]|nr:cell wall hydrolase [Anaerovoracaceae bacterium]